jgi:tetratricopeptide (TPR) repeat protein
MGVMPIRSSLRLLLCVLLIIGLVSSSEAARRKKRKEPVIVTPPTLVERAQAVRLAIEKRAHDPQVPLGERVRAALRIGSLAVGDSDWVILTATDSALAQEIRTELLLETYQFEDAAQAARAELALRLLKYDDAEAQYRRLLSRAPDAAWTSRAATGLARALGKRERFQESLDTLLTLMDSTRLSDDALANMGLALIYLSRVNEAIELFEEAAHWNPYNELAQSCLGNGYCRLSYRQLREKNDSFFPAEASPLKAEARGLFAAGDTAQAAQSCRSTADAFPRDVESRTVLGSIFWEQGRLDSAAARFREALALLPNYGRARNGLAKALEGMRVRQSVHRAADSAAFARAPMPDVPRIEEFVLNWHRLSPRHRKQVALSVVPWKAYLPVLIECGSRCYIKPLHELLSECPNLTSLRDQRIDLDSRLWDDVRGCGGFTIVSGIEDVERCIFRGHNTVLHELTHQVHGVLPEKDADRVRDLFHAARIREDGGQPTFMSRYQQSSVWEYFAEGANALYSPRRDEYDGREIVRERLMERDTVLAAAVQHFASGPNLTACYAVGLVNAAKDALENERTSDALLFANKAFARAPHSEAVLTELVKIHSILDRDSMALAFADSFLTIHPRRAAAHTSQASARFFLDGDNGSRIEFLTRALEVVDSSQRDSVRQGLGRALWYEGRYAEAAEQYRAILRDVRDDPDALWGLGLALGDGGNAFGADSAFRAALLRRSGIVDLRLDYARILLQGGRLDEAAAQLEEAQLLARGDPMVIALKGWYTAQRGNYKEALRLLDRAVELAPDQRLSWILRLDVRRQYTPPKRRDPLKRDPPKKEAGNIRLMEQTDVPTWVFQARTATYVAARTWPHFQRELLKRIADDL